jgi:hypothetical protein
LTTAEINSVPLTAKQEQLIIYINQQVNKIVSNGGDDVAILISLAGIMKDLKKILDSANKHELEIYTQKYNGFYHFMKVLETLAVGIADGSIPVPAKD